MYDKCLTRWNNVCVCVCVFLATVPRQSQVLKLRMMQLLGDYGTSVLN